MELIIVRVCHLKLKSYQWSITKGFGGEFWVAYSIFSESDTRLTQPCGDCVNIAAARQPFLLLSDLSELHPEHFFSLIRVLFLLIFHAGGTAREAVISSRTAPQIHGSIPQIFIVCCGVNFLHFHVALVLVCSPAMEYAGARHPIERLRLLSPVRRSHSGDARSLFKL